MGVQGATLGPYDLAQGFSWLAEKIPLLPVPIVVTNATGPEWAEVVKPSLVIEAGGIRIGVLGLVPPGDVAGLSDPEQAARKEAEALRSRGVDLVIGLSSLGLRHSKRLLRKDLPIDLLLAGGQDLRAIVTDEVEPFRESWLFQSFVQGGQIGRLDIVVDGSSGPIGYLEPDAVMPTQGAYFRYALTPIGWDLPADSEVTALMEAYDRELRDINLANAGTLPPLPPGQPYYVGVENCLSCHEETQAFWDNDKHKVAWATLENDGKTFDLECVSCHVTGYGEPGGSILGNLKNLTSVQCEQCHGPGSAHAEDGDPDLIRRGVPATVCVTCHNEKHSTGFEYRTYRSRLLVPGHGL
jgi:hypothetical protein